MNELFIIKSHLTTTVFFALLFRFLITTPINMIQYKNIHKRHMVTGQNPPGQNPPDKTSQDKIPLDKIPLGQNPPEPNPPKRNPPGQYPPKPKSPQAIKVQSFLYMSPLYYCPHPRPLISIHSSVLFSPVP